MVKNPVRLYKYIKRRCFGLEKKKKERGKPRLDGILIRNERLKGPKGRCASGSVHGTVSASDIRITT